MGRRKAEIPRDPRGQRPGGALEEAAVGANVPFWSGSFSFQGKTYPYTMVGTDPSAGSVTSTIPVVIIPLKFVFFNGTTLSASDPVCGGTASAVTLTQASPLFEDFPFAPGGTDVGTTQYIDAFQRANFWNHVSTTSPDYHVLLSSTVQATQTVVVPPVLGLTRKGPCAKIGQVNLIFFDQLARGLIATLGIPPTSLFLTYNTFFTQGGCCILGYHSATSGNQTYAVALVQ